MHAPLQLRRRFPIVGGALIVALIAGIWVTDTASTASAAQMQTAETAYSEALSTVLAERTAAVTQVTAARAELTTAAGSLASSTGKVLSPEAPDALSAAVAAAEPLVAGAERELAAGGSALTAILTTPKERPAAYEAATSAMQQLHPVGVHVDLVTPTQAVTVAILAWQDEHDRQVAEASAASKASATKAAAVARAAAVKAAATQAAANDSAAGPSGPAQPHKLIAPGPNTAPRSPVVAQTTWNVWTAGKQAQVDMCKGPVDVTEWYTGLPVILEHWGCGGSGFPQTPGATVTLTGLHAGIWRVDGVVATLAFGVDSIMLIPEGHELLYQTCNNNNSATMVFIALTKIG